MEYSFDKERHIHFLDGSPVPGVTSIIDAAGLVSSFCKNEAAAERGRNGHLLCQLVYSGEKLSWNIPKVSLPWIIAIERFVEEQKIVPSQIEFPVWSKLGYAGIPDLLTEDLTLFDNKFWSSINKQSLGNAGLQTVGYSLAINESYGIRVRKRAVVIFNIDKARPYTIRYLNDPADKPNFLSCLNVFKLRAKYEKFNFSDDSKED